MRPSPLQLDGYLVTELRYKAQPDFQYDLDNPITTVTPDDLTVETAFSAHEKERLRRSCELTIELTDATGAKFPYVFRTALIGFFRISEQYPADGADLMFITNAPALLYSAARELLATVTGRGPYPAVTLPSVTFLPLPSESAKSDAADARFDKPVQKTLSARKASKTLAKRKTKPTKKNSSK